MARTLEEVLAIVTETDTKLDGIRELIVGLREQVKAIGNLTPEQQVKIDAIFDKAAANNAEIDEALTANTPAVGSPVSET